MCRGSDGGVARRGERIASTNRVDALDRAPSWGARWERGCVGSFRRTRHDLNDATKVRKRRAVRTPLARLRRAGCFSPSVLGWRTQSRASPQATYSKASRPEECVFQALRGCRSSSPSHTFRPKRSPVEMQELTGIRITRVPRSSCVANCWFGVRLFRPNAWH